MNTTLLFFNREPKNPKTDRPLAAFSTTDKQVAGEVLNQMAQSGYDIMDIQTFVQVDEELALKLQSAYIDSERWKIINYRIREALIRFQYVYIQVK